jgi:hypothetical protein
MTSRKNRDIAGMDWQDIEGNCCLQCEQGKVFLVAVLRGNDDGKQDSIAPFLGYPDDIFGLQLFCERGEVPILLLGNPVERRPTIIFVGLGSQGEDCLDYDVIVLELDRHKWLPLKGGIVI